MQKVPSLVKHVIPRSLTIGMIRRLTVGDLDAGWLECDGSLLSPIVYPVLHGKISAAGYPWGGDINAFAIPDLRSRSTMGRGTGAGMPARALGERIGEAAHVLSVGEMPLHGHSLQMMSTQYFTNLTGTGNVTLYNWNAINTSQAGNDQAHENQQPSLGLRYVIFTGVIL